MLGTIVNSLAIILGGIVGLLLKKGIPEKMKKTVLHGVGLAVLLIGLKMALQTENELIVIICLLVGGLLGEALRIDRGLERFGELLQSKLGKKEGDFVQGFVTASLIFCIGAMAIIGSIESGINQNHQVLYTKATLDMITCAILTSTFGIGALFSFLPVFIYQGLLTLLAAGVADYLTPQVVSYMSATGGLLIVGISMNIMEIKKINVANLLPAIFVAVFVVTFLAKIRPGFL